MTFKLNLLMSGENLLAGRAKIFMKLSTPPIKIEFNDELM